MSKKVILKPGKEKSLKRRHPWIFSGAVDMYPSFSNGDVLSVVSSKGEFLAKAFFHRDRSLAGRVLSFVDEPLEEALAKRLQEACDLRNMLIDTSVTNAYRLINAEGDGLPGLIVDVYDTVCVLQVNTLGMWKLKSQIVEHLKSLLAPQAIYEKSVSIVRDLEGLEDSCGFLFGEATAEIEVKENDIRYIVNYQEGQKTGFFLDQREMRALVGSLAKGKRVLNCFSYSGGFSLAALKGGATHVTSVDSSSRATDLCVRNTELGGFSLADHSILKEDVFTFLKESSLDYDLIILDPPSFAKRKHSIPKACRGYKELNRFVFKKAPSGSLLLTCSCTGLVQPTLFQDVVAQAASEEERGVRILSYHVEASDHPHSLFHPEGRYLKSLLLYLGSR